RMGIASTLVFVISRIYFLMVLMIFRMVNHFKARKSVPPPNDPLLMLSATEAVRKIRKREITSQQLIGAYTHRIEQVNELINAVVIKLFNEAKQKAEEVDKSIADMDDHQLEEFVRSKPLLGVPFTAKDALEVDGQVITCGIYAQKGIKRSSTAEVIKRMEAAGAILIAITNVPEACYWVETSNGIYGLTSNPYDTRRTVGGSSGGEGALISAAGSLIGIGSDIGGSIRIPSFMNGIFGMKNTPGIIPLKGHVPPVTGYPEEMLRVGPMCRYVEDLPILIEVMGGDKVPQLRLSDPVNFSKIRIYYMEGIQIPTLQSLSCEMRSTLLEAVKHFETKFNVEAIRLDLPLAQKAVEMLFASLEVEGEPKPSEYLLSLEGDKGKLNWKLEIPKYLVGKSVHTPGALLVAMIEDIDRTPETKKDEFRKLRSRLVRQITETLGDNGILLFPSWPQTAPFHHQTVFTPFNCVYTGLFNVLALPVVQCPTGLDSSGLPLGVQVVGSRNADRLLVAAAKEISNTFGGWKAPWTQ
ncbi:hypothetical protein V3C99_003194, partial [Haemonchus contortus]